MEEDRLESYFPAMRDFPRTAIPGNERDNNYPPLAWEDYAADVLISRFGYPPKCCHELKNLLLTSYLPPSQ